MIVLSYYPSYKLSNHDACVAIARDGEILYAFEEQKLSRVNTRESKYLPDRALLSALYTTGIDPKSIDVLSVVGFEQVFDPQEIAQRIEKYFGITVHRSVACPHHAAHAALAAFAAPFQKGLFWTIDAGGEDRTFGDFGTFDADGMKVLYTIEKPSIATFYQLMTGCCGFADFEEGKIMGLAAYGAVDQKLYDGMRSLFSFEGPGHAQFNGIVNYKYPLIRWDKFSHDEYRPYKVVQYLRRDLCPELDRMTRGHLPEVIAATGQKLAEDLVIESLRRMTETFCIKAENLTLAGGLFLNIIINKRLRETFKCEIFVPPGVNDMGLAVGGALWANQFVDPDGFAAGRARGRRLSAYLGPSFKDDEIENLAQRFPLKSKRLSEDDLLASAARAIADGKVVGWFQGRGEFGPRALGARSVLADPRNPQSKSRINQLLKKRDWFMPYAPAIMEEHASAYIKDACHAPYMTLAFDSIDNAVESVPSAIHVDGTVRPQIINNQDNPLFHKLIDAFRRLTGVAMILNTSFNRHGVPIVATPRHAIEHLIEGVVDVLYVGSYEMVVNASRDVQIPDIQAEPLLQAILGIKHGYELLREGDPAAAETVFRRTGRDVRWNANLNGGIELTIDGQAFDMTSTSWDAVTSSLGQCS